MKIKTSELVGIPLDWAVAKCEGAGSALVLTHSRGKALILSDHTEDFDVGEHYQPSINWSQGGLIIARERIGVVTSPDDANVWIGSIFEPDWKFNRTGLTPLIAAMRCYVASKLGDEVDVPDEIIQGESK